MRLIRFLPKPSEIRKIYQERDAGKPAPIHVLKGLMPSDKEVDHISLYEVEAEEDAIFILAAFSLVAKGDFAVVSVDRIAVEGLGVSLKKSKATTDSELVNDRHWDAYFGDGQQAFSLAELFYGGDFIAYEAAEVRRQIALDCLAGRLNLKAAAAKADANRPAKICEIIAKSAMILAAPV